MGRRGGVVPSLRLARIVQALLAQHGTVKTAQIMGCGREVVVRIAARQPVRAGSIALAEKNTSSLEKAA